MAQIEIGKAAEFTLSALTLKEKTTAKGLLYNEQYRKLSGAVWLRAPVLDLGAALDQARKGANAQGYKAKFVNLFCDTLTIQNGCEIVPELDEGRDVMFSIEIFVRKIVFPQQYATDAFNVRFTQDSELVFWASRLPEHFQFSFQTPTGTKGSFTPVIEPESFGVQVQCEDSTPTNTQYPKPDMAMENINYMDLISEDGKLLDKGFRNDDLPRLLQMQLLIAQAHTTLNRPFALELLDYVIAATATPRGAHIFYQVNALRNNLTIQADTMSVPSVNVYASKQVLKSRLLAAAAFEDAFRDFMLEAGTTHIQAETALNMLAKSNDAIETYTFLKSIRVREYDIGVSANDKAGQTLKKTQSQLEDLSQKFQDGIAKWKQEHIKSAVKDIFVGIIQLGVAIGVTVATGGATASAAISAGTAVVSGASKIAQLIAKLKQIFDQLEKVYKRIKPVIDKLTALVKTTKAVIDALRDFDTAKVGTTDLKAPVQSEDVFNATADWRRFDITVRDMEMSLAEYKDIDGKTEYFRALKMLVVDGETYILTQANLVQKGDELATVIVQEKMQRRDDTRLTATAGNIANDAAVLDLLARAMFDRILAIRSMVYLDFFTYTEAYRYHTLSDDAVVMLSPVKPVVDYLEDAARLQGAVVAFGSKVMVQQRLFRLRTLCGFSNVRDLADALTSGQSVSVDLTPEDAIWDGFGRIRVSCARCWLEGAKTSVQEAEPALPIRVELKADGKFFDHDLTTSSIDLETSSTTRSFIGVSRTLIFEYQPGTGVILCDGLFGQERDYTKHTPISSWSIRLVDGGSDTLSLADLDLSGLSGISLEFLCDVTWKR